MTDYEDVREAFNEFVRRSNAYVKNRIDAGVAPTLAGIDIEILLEHSMGTHWEASMSCVDDDPEFEFIFPTNGLREVPREI